MSEENIKIAEFRERVTKKARDILDKPDGYRPEIIRIYGCWLAGLGERDLATKLGEVYKKKEVKENEEDKS